MARVLPQPPRHHQPVERADPTPKDAKDAMLRRREDFLSRSPFIRASENDIDLGADPDAADRPTNP